MGSELIDVISELLALVKDEASSGPTLDALELLLDRLALVRHDIPTRSLEGDCADAPDWRYDERRRLVDRAFPMLGLYASVAEAVNLGDQSEFSTCDAADDLADIVGDLAEVAWRWSNTSEDDARWYFRWSYDAHWGAHLRSLQLYLHGFRR